MSQEGHEDCCSVGSGCSCELSSGSCSVCEEDPDAPLPDDWQRAWDAAGHVYYWNTITRESKWTLKSVRLAAVDFEAGAGGAARVADATHGGARHTLPRRTSASPSRMESTATAERLAAVQCTGNDGARNDDIAAARMPPGTQITAAAADFASAGNADPMTSSSVDDSQSCGGGSRGSLPHTPQCPRSPAAFELSPGHQAAAAAHSMACDSPATAAAKEEAQKRLHNEIKQRLSSLVIQGLLPFHLGSNESRHSGEAPRIASSAEFKKLARKLTHTVQEKELSKARQRGLQLEITDKVRLRVRDYVRAYVKQHCKPLSDGLPAVFEGATAEESPASDSR